MNIAVECYTCICMAEQFTESFRVKSVFYANSCIGMSKEMKVDISDTAKLQNRLKAILHGPWLSRLASSGDDIKVIILSFFPLP